MQTGFEEVVYSLGESSGSVLVCAEILSPAVAEREFFLLLSSSNRDAGTNSPTIVLCVVRTSYQLSCPGTRALTPRLQSVTCSNPTQGSSSFFHGVKEL